MGRRACLQGEGTFGPDGVLVASADEAEEGLLRDVRFQRLATQVPACPTRIRGPLKTVRAAAFREPRAHRIPGPLRAEKCSQDTAEYNTEPYS